MSPNYWLNNLWLLALAFLPYFVGIVIRKTALPGPNSPSLRNQLLLGVPVSLLVLPPMLPVIARTMTDWSVLVSCGLIMEQGMIVHETVTAQLQRLIGRQVAEPAARALTGPQP